MKAGLFRETSRDAASSPDELEDLMRVTRPKSWIALAGIGILLVSAGAWAVVGNIPEKVNGNGILVRAGGIVDVVPTAGGRVIDAAIGVGDTVSQGQVVARIAQPELADEINAARIELQTQRALHEQIASITERTQTLQAGLVEEMKADLEQSIHSSEAALQWLEQRVRAQERLVEQGLIIPQTLHDTKQQYNAALQKIDADRSRLKQIDVQELERGANLQEELLASEARVRKAELMLRQLESGLGRTSEVVSAYRGRVMEVLVQTGSLVQPADPLLRLEPIGPSVQSLTAIIYVTPAEGKKLAPGMTIHVAPSTVRREEFGLMVGRVTFVSDFPATPERMRHTLKNEQLATALSSTGAPYEVHAEFTPSPQTASGYEWTSPAGPPIRIESGTLCSAQITVGGRRPMEIVLPILATGP